MRYSLMTTAFILDEKEGTLEIDYYLANLTQSERLSVFINGEERCNQPLILIIII